MLQQKTAECEPSSAEPRGGFGSAAIPLAGPVLTPALFGHPPRRHLQNTRAAHSSITGDTGQVVAGTGGEKVVNHRMLLLLNLRDI